MIALHGEPLDNRHWPFNGRTVIAFCALLIVYVAVAQWTEFYPLSWPMPDQHWIDHRSGECAILWTGGFVLLGLVRAVIQRRRLSETARVWHVWCVPVIVCGAEAMQHLWELMTEGPFRDPRTGRIDRYFLSLSIALVILPVLYAGIVAASILWPVRLWRRSSLADRCRRCGYNLTGNTSGICPECGTAIEPESTTSRN